MTNPRLESLQERLGVRFRNTEYLTRALVHRSAISETQQESNERMEFLGDSVLGMIVCEQLLERFPNYTEGQLAKAKAYIVSEAALAPIALSIDLDKCVILNPAEAAAGGRNRPSILSDALEALFAAIYLDSGFEVVKRVVRELLSHPLAEVTSDLHRKDYKSSLQIITQAYCQRTPVYSLVDERGRDHEKVFVVQASLGEEVLGRGEGRSKKEAEQCAAQQAVENLPLYLLPFLPQNSE